MIWYYSIQVCVQPSALVNAISNMLVLPVFLTRHSSIKVRRENDCKDKTQILKIKKKTILSNFNKIIKAFIRFQYILACWHGYLIRNPLEVTSVFTLFVASLFSSLLSFSTCGASSSCIFRSNAASSAFRLFSSSSLFQTLEAISLYSPSVLSVFAILWSSLPMWKSVLNWHFPVFWCLYGKKHSPT